MNYLAKDMTIGFVWSLRASLLLLMVAGLSGCAGGPQLAPEDMPLPKVASSSLEQNQMVLNAPIFIRIFKEESEFEVWKKRADGFFYHFKTYPICNWSGNLGPKQRQGDRQAPEGFYTVWPGYMNPKSKFHLSFNLGYPNRLDKSYGRTGNHLMVHGDCTSSGCYAMTNALVEEIYALAREAIKGGQKGFRVQAFPFRMTEANLKRHRKSKWYRFWMNLKEGYDAFEKYRIPPQVHVCGRRYKINRHFAGRLNKNPAAACPRSRTMKLAEFTGPAYTPIGTPIGTLGPLHAQPHNATHMQSPFPSQN